MSEDTKRVLFTFSKEGYETLQSLANKEGKSVQEVMSEAIGVYKSYSDYKQKGFTSITLTNPKTNVNIVLFPGS